MTTRSALLALLISLTMIACAPKAKVLEAPVAQHIKTGIKQGTKTFDHSAYDALLQKHVDAKTHRVNYTGLKADRAKLNSYLNTLAAVDLKQYTGDALMALLINAYNGYTLSLILDHYPGVKSIKDLKAPWKTARYKVGGATLSLDNIEHNLLRPIYKDPRIHFAVNCASIGCPPLMNRAFTGATLNAQLDEATRTALRSPKYVRMEGETLKLTSILNWYGKDFINPDFKGHKKTVAAYVAQYTTPTIKTSIEKQHGEPNTSFLDYDWRLNDSQTK